MTRLKELNQEIRRQPTRTVWLPELSTPSSALGACLTRADVPRQSISKVADSIRPSGARLGLLAALRRAWRRQQTIARLRSLSDWMLDDIGIERGQIPESVDRMLAQSDPKPAA
jgi:uncharacterized protein YjiS (DUF1127 family)